MAVYVSNARELKKAVKNREQTIIVTGKFAKKLGMLLTPLIGGISVTSGMSATVLGATIAPLVGLPVSVAIALILAVSVVTIIAIVREYNVKISPTEGIILEKKP